MKFFLHQLQAVSARHETRHFTDVRRTNFVFRGSKMHQNQSLPCPKAVDKVLIRTPMVICWRAHLHWRDAPPTLLTSACCWHRFPLSHGGCGCRCGCGGGGDSRARRVRSCAAFSAWPARLRTHANRRDLTRNPFAKTNGSSHPIRLMQCISSFAVLRECFLHANLHLISNPFVYRLGTLTTRWSSVLLLHRYKQPPSMRNWWLLCGLQHRTSEKVDVCCDTVTYETIVDNNQALIYTSVLFDRCCRFPLTAFKNNYSSTVQY